MFPGEAARNQAPKVDIALLLTPSATLVAFIFNLLVLLDPVSLQSAQFAFLYVKPSGEADGPTLFLGLLGSCSRPDNEAQFNCTSMSFAPTYILSDYPAQQLLSPPPSSAGATIFITLSLVSSGIFFLAFLAMERGWSTRPFIKTLANFSGFIAWLCGICGFIIASVWFRKVADDFNEINGDDAPLVAVTGEAFTMGFVSIILGGLAVILSMITHIGKKKKKANPRPQYYA
ncbi:hypothetical protein GGX14DRAFT_406446 [Mycena pura]|uniref:Uncharacterized protein n=1 Tax=Mycena pura TaxID=153505 RepID=A0AAD6XY81_9AGAR|nr:hypothetical protein GGX14DRAFT_406446 [Mycena pura]